MKQIAVAFAVVFVAAAAAGDAKFSASAVKGVGIGKPGKVVISNQGRTITAYHFHGNVSEALVRLRSRPTPLNYQPFGPVVFDERATLPKQVPNDVASAIHAAAVEHGVDPRLVLEIAKWESGFSEKAVSNKGALGVMQLMPATAQYVGVTNVFDLRQNVFGGTKYLRELLDTFRGDLDLTLAAYNAGPGAVERWGGVPPYQETVNYVRGIRTRYEQAVGR